MSEEELERLRQIECSNFEVDIVDKAVITIKKMQQEKQEIIKWLKDNIKLCNETINDLNKPHFADEIEIEVPMKLIIAAISQVNYLEVLDKVRRFNK